jgi:hypothetical protein
LVAKARLSWIALMTLLTTLKNLMFRMLRGIAYRDWFFLGAHNDLTDDPTKNECYRGSWGLLAETRLFLDHSNDLSGDPKQFEVLGAPGDCLRSQAFTWTPLMTQLTTLQNIKYECSGVCLPKLGFFLERPNDLTDDPENLKFRRLRGIACRRHASLGIR